MDQQSSQYVHYWTDLIIEFLYSYLQASVHAFNRGNVHVVVQWIQLLGCQLLQYRCLWRNWVGCLDIIAWVILRFNLVLQHVVLFLADLRFLKLSLKEFLYKFINRLDIVSPAYGFIALALVKCSNEGGPGPRYNMKEDPGSSIFSMLVVYGYYLYLLLLFSEPGD